MGILDKVSGAGRNVSDKTKNMSELSNLKRKIQYENDRIMEIFSDMGQSYYKNPEDLDTLKSYCDDIDTRRRRIKKMKFEYQTIKGYKTCPKCGAEVMEKFQFCGVCGSKLPDINDDDDFAV